MKWLRVTLLSLALIAFKIVGVAEAQSLSLTPGNVLLTATFEAISFRTQFAGDANANARVTVQFKQNSETLWHTAYPPFIDRRATIGGVSNPYASEARGSIVGLVPNTTYQVQVTWTDPDGVSGPIR